MRSPYLPILAVAIPVPFPATKEDVIGYQMHLSEGTEISDPQKKES